jgi:hypothetical protein
MKIPVAVVTLSVALALASGAEARGRMTDSPHMRPATEASAAFVANAGTRSQDVRDLTKTLEQSNVVAYVHLAPTQPGQPTSCLRFAGRSAYQRFVVITIGSDLPADRQVALLGHELQHAAEIAGVSWVSNPSDLDKLMALIGWRDASRVGGYETSAALGVERHVARALANAKPTP